MSHIDEFDLNNICRTCLATENLKPLHSTKDPFVMLTLCTSVECYVNDGLPVQMCTDCITELKRAYTFALKCRESDHTLRNYIQKYETHIYNFGQCSKSLTDTIKCAELRTDLNLDVVHNELDVTIKTEPIDSFDQEKAVAPVTFETVKFEPPVMEFVDMKAATQEEQPVANKPILIEILSHGPQELATNHISTNVHKHHINGEIEIQVSKTVQRLYSCKSCDTSFTKKINLKQKTDELNKHLRPETGDRPFLCTICNKSFARKGILNIHIRSHTKEKPYSCPICKKAFCEKSKVTRHMWMHTDHKPHLCVLCNKSFGQKVHLKNHMRIHTGEKPFPCPICHKFFNQKKNLTAHKRSQHKDNVALFKR